jgi:hypothetical protein
LLSAGDESALVASAIGRSGGHGGSSGRRPVEYPATTASDCIEAELTFAVELVQVADGQFQDVGLFQFGEIFTFGRQCGAH